MPRPPTAREKAVAAEDQRRRRDHDGQLLFPPRRKPTRKKGVPYDDHCGAQCGEWECPACAADMAVAGKLTPDEPDYREMRAYVLEILWRHRDLLVKTPPYQWEADAPYLASLERNRAAALALGTGDPRRWNSRPSRARHDALPGALRVGLPGLGKRR